MELAPTTAAFNKVGLAVGFSAIALILIAATRGRLGYVTDGGGVQ